MAKSDLEFESRYQRPVIYNKELAYCGLLEDEAAQLMEEMRGNLSSAIQEYDLWPGALYWTNRLNRLACRRSRRSLLLCCGSLINTCADRETRCHWNCAPEHFGPPGLILVEQISNVFR